MVLLLYSLQNKPLTFLYMDTFLESNLTDLQEIIIIWLMC